MEQCRTRAAKCGRHSRGDGRGSKLQALRRQTASASTTLVILDAACATHVLGAGVKLRAHVKATFECGSVTSGASLSRTNATPATINNVDASPTSLQRSHGGA